MVKRGKIPILTVVGLGLGLKNMFDLYTATPDNLKTDAMVNMMTGYASPQYLAAGGAVKTWDFNHAVRAYAPMIGGGMASKYLGGPKGLNLNAQLRNVPLFKL